ncbi:DUF4349 domain-containing protein [uncultured Tenacibaculum sp.]|uniref:DUF4349 domain-containing protein n=1 Tax=uncultured Tenacibaculum sp. TaxID=174713 RepID=UPI00260E4BD5|nr:DUF4349 domain-containing protein [uncultured Tenacibaculum sp.]
MKILTYLLFSFVFLLGCGGGNSNTTSPESVDYGNAEILEVEASATKEFSKPSNPSEAIQRKLIKRGDISFETNDLSKTRNHIEQTLQKFNGYVSEDNQYKSLNNITNNLTVRIPSQNFDAFLNELSTEVDKFDHKNVSVNDVTEQFLDIEARLGVKKALEQRYNQLLQKAKSVKEILEIEKELASVRSDIESMEGRLQYLQNQVSYSTLSIRYYKVELTKSSSKGFWRRLGNAFFNGIDNIKWFFIGLVNIWPFILLLVGGIYLLRKRIKRKK